MITHTLGNPFDLREVKAFCECHNLWLVEDNCDALGSQYTIGDITKYTGTWGDIGTSSFYPPHHMTMGEGGCVYTDSPLLNMLIKSYRDWGRDCSCPREWIIYAATDLMGGLGNCRKDMTINMYTAILDTI